MPIIIDASETRPEILELVARVEAIEGSDEAYFLNQLRTALFGFFPKAARRRPPCIGEVPPAAAP
jgi:hypothetical protein